VIRVGINGFGRIGRNFLKASLRGGKFEVVAVNDLTDARTLAHLLKFDSVYKKFSGDAGYKENYLIVNGREIKVFSERDPLKLSWGKIGVDIVLESTGVFRRREQAEMHLKSGAKKVIISAPPRGEAPVKQIVMGVNENTYDPGKDNIISNASCTTNCFAPVSKVLNSNFIIKEGIMTTVHAYTADQRLLDAPHKDLRRARAASASIIPTTTGSAKALSEVIPELKGRVTASAIRVPVIDGSLIDFVVDLEKNPDVDEVNSVFKEVAKKDMNGIIEYSEESIVSADIIGNPHSAIFDSLLTRKEKGLIEVFAWYDNEWGYSCRLVDLINFIIKKGI